MTKAGEILLNLLKVSLGVEPDEGVFCGATAKVWNELVDIAYDQGVAALSVVGYNQWIQGDRDLGIPGVLLEGDELEDLRLDWFGSVFQAEADYRYKLRKAAGFAEALDARGVECKVLKGMAFSLYYRYPEHRECGDCDVYLGPSWALGNEVAVELGGRYEFGTYKHSHLFFGKLMVENHKYLTDFNGTKQGKKIERLLEEVIEEAPGRRIGDSRLVCPNDHFNALFLIRHAHGNFMYGGLTLRMVYDWAALLLKCGRELDWKRIWDELEVCRLRGFAEVMCSLCVRYFGVSSGLVGGVLCKDDALVEEVMMDTLSGGINTRGRETFWLKCVRIGRRFLRIWHYRGLATESVGRMIWNNFAFSSYLGRKRVEM